MHLKNNDLVALVSPAGYLNNKNVVIQAQNLLKKWGLRSYVGKYALAQNGHFAGTDKQRLEDLQTAIDHPEVKMIWALRGGYGSIRIVDKLNLTHLKKYPKILAGFSDITILHNRLHQAGFPSLHIFMPVQLKEKIDKQVIWQTKNALFGRGLEYNFNNSLFTTNFIQVKGILTGGNLANLYSLLGTDLDVDVRGKILFIEDVGEQLYQIDRMLIAMKKANKFNDLKALLVGQFTDIPNNRPFFGKKIEEIILEHTLEYNFPVIFNAPVGHITNNYPLIFGKELKLSQENDKIRLNQLLD